MIDKPEFNPDYTLVVVEGEAAYLVSERGHVVIKGPGPMSVARAIHEGTPSVRDLVAADLMPTQALYAPSYRARRSGVGDPGASPAACGRGLVQVSARPYRDGLIYLEENHER